MNSITSDFTTILPDAISQEIFSYLDLTSLVWSNKVNRNWHKLTADNSLWVPIAKKYFSYLLIPEGCQNTKAYLSKFLVLSPSALLNRLREFVQKLQLNQRGEFCCKLYEKKDSFFIAKFAFINNNFRGFTLKENYFYGDQLTPNKDIYEASIKVGGTINKKYILSYYHLDGTASIDRRYYYLNFDLSFMDKVEKILVDRLVELYSQVKNNERKYLGMIAATSICAAAVLYSYFA